MTKLNLKELRTHWGFRVAEKPAYGSVMIPWERLELLLDWIERAKGCFQILEQCEAEGVHFMGSKCEPDCTCVRHDWVKLLAELEE